MLYTSPAQPSYPFKRPITVARFCKHFQGFAALRSLLRMMPIQEAVHEFMVKAGQATPTAPTLPDMDVRYLRVKLIAQELRELANAYGVRLTMDTDAPEAEIHLETSQKQPVPEDLLDALDPVYDATLDILVVTVGNAVATGLDLDPGFDDVHAANMRKFDGGYRAADGKWMKPPNWQPPNLRAVIAQQIRAAREQPELPSLLDPSPQSSTHCDMS